MAKRLSILAPTRYPWRFNGPRESRHDIDIRIFAPLNKISNYIEGVTFFNPWPPRSFDLIHAFNRIPLGKTPFIIGFESHLPRAFGLENSAYFRWLSGILASERCKGIFAISNFAKNMFTNQHAGRPWADQLAGKLHVRYPNISIPALANKGALNPDEPVRIFFVGSHFGRKGGCVVVRLAQLAAAQGIKLHIDLVSKLETGAISWIDPLRKDFFTPYLEQLGALSNLKHHGELPNRDVVRLMKDAHFSILPTFSDTFGYSAIESMTHCVPVIATRQGALPEFIHHNQNGFLLDLETDSNLEWSVRLRKERDSPAYERLFKEETDRLANAALGHIMSCLSNPDAYKEMRLNAYNTARALFSADDANVFWDGIYEDATR